MSIDSDYHEFMRQMYERNAKKKAQANNRPKRSVTYKAPGHTIVYYKNRTLHIYFKESKEEFLRKTKGKQLRRTKNHLPKAFDDTIYVDRDEYGNMIYITSTGRDAGLKSRNISARGNNAILKRKLSKDEYTIEDMRALLRDDHWEEVAGNKRWNYDSKATVREFHKYLKSNHKR